MVELERQFADQLLGIVGRGGHGRHARGMLARARLQQRRVDRVFERHVHERVEQALPVRLEDVLPLPLLFLRPDRHGEEGLRAGDLLQDGLEALVDQHDLVRLAARIELAQVCGELGRLLRLRGVADLKALADGDVRAGDHVLAPAAADDQELLALLLLRELLQEAQQGGVVGAAEAAVAHDQHVADARVRLVRQEQRLLRLCHALRHAAEHFGAARGVVPQGGIGALCTAKLGAGHHFHGFCDLLGVLHTLDARADGAQIRHALASLQAPLCKGSSRKAGEGLCSLI